MSNSIKNTVSTRLVPWMAGAALVVLSAAGCANLLGLEERELGGGGAGGGGPVYTEQCQAYCDTVIANCVGTLEVYASEQTCLDTCSALPPGDDDEPEGTNTVACRQQEAERAGAVEPEQHCPNAGPAGNGVCGSNCAAWCDLLEPSCTDEFDLLTDCEAACGAFADTGTFNLDDNYNGDTVQCRLIHLGAAFGDPIHCDHGAYEPGSKCIDENPTASCDDYCRRVMATCSHPDEAVYESAAQCQATCAAFGEDRIGEVGERDSNTIACRSYHADSSAYSPDQHCSHAAASGDGHCGLDADDSSTTGSCDSYCILLETGCPSQFATLGSQAACASACATQMADKGAVKDSGFALKTAGDGDTLQCRFLELARALDEGSEDRCPQIDLAGVCSGG